MNLRERIKVHVKGHNVFLVQRDKIYCEIVDGMRGKTIPMENIDELQQILENLHTYVLDEDIEIDYFIDRNINLQHECPNIAFNNCSICYSITERTTVCDHSVCLVCASHISHCPLCRRVV